MMDRLSRDELGVVRAAIRNAAEEIFLRPIIIEERAFHVLEVLPQSGRNPKSTHIWAAISHSFPAISMFYDRIGFDLETNLPSPRDILYLSPGLLSLSISAWKHTLRNIFCIQGYGEDQLVFTSAGDLVKANGRIGIDSIVLGILESGRLDLRTSRRKTSHALRYLARASGIKNPQEWDDRLLRFSYHAGQVFQSLQVLDQSFSTQQFILYHDSNGVRLSPFGTNGAYQLCDTRVSDGSLLIGRGNVIQPCSRFSDAAIAELEDLINSDATESCFQEYFERNPELLLALGNYQNAHPQLVLHEENGTSYIPDFFLEKIGGGHFCDICDIKRSNVDLVRRQRNRHRFKDMIMEGVAQLTYYRDWFESPGNRNWFRDIYDLQTYRPQVVLIIGRHRSFTDEMERIVLESQLPSWVRLTTYDDVVARARQWRRLVQA